MGGIRKPPEPPRPSIVRMELETMELGVCETIWINWKRHGYAFRLVCVSQALFFVHGFGPYRFSFGKENEMKGTENETMGMRIKKRRAMLALSQDDLAEIMKVPKTTISSYENDRIDVKGSVIIELSQRLMTTPSYLLLGESDPTEEKDPYLERMTSLLQRVTDENARKILEIQIRALASGVR